MRWTCVCVWISSYDDTDDDGCGGDIDLLVSAAAAAVGNRVYGSW